MSPTNDLGELGQFLTGKSTPGVPLKNESPLFGEVNLSDEQSGREGTFTVEKFFVVGADPALWGV